MKSKTTDRIAVAIFIFPGVDVLDFTGPLEVFSRTRTEPGAVSRSNEDSAPFRVFTVAKTSEPVPTASGVKVLPEFSFGSSTAAAAAAAAAPPTIDLLVVPGGLGTRPLLNDRDSLEWIQATAAQAKYNVSSVCTGALLLAKAGLLRDQAATTHWCAYDLLQETDPTITVMRKREDADDDHGSDRHHHHPCRFVKSKSGVYTSAGVSAGIDMSFQIVEDLCGKQVADETARYIEFRRAPADGGGASPSS